MMSPKQISDDRGSPHFRHIPFQILHLIGNFFRIWSVYSMYRYLNQTGAPVVLFLFYCLVPSSIIFLILEKPWKGRALSNQQIVPSLINGVITALYFIFWGKGLKSCGPLRSILSEYSGAVLGVLSGVLYGRRGHVWKKLLAFEAIPTLGKAFREPVEEADKSCPLMCHSTFKKGNTHWNVTLGNIQRTWSRDYHSQHHPYKNFKSRAHVE